MSSSNAAFPQDWKTAGDSNDWARFALQLLGLWRETEDTLSGAQISHITFVGETCDAQVEQPKASEDTKENFSYTNIIQKK